ncbi:MAG: ImpA family metalloprotease [Candidatus Sedimenticola sp. 1PA]
MHKRLTTAVFTALYVAGSGLSYSSESALPLGFGGLSAGHEWVSTQQRTAEDTAVILGTPSNNDAEPGVTEIGVKDEQLQIRFREWGYLDGKHSEEQIGWLIAKPGTYKSDDGTIVEVGRVTIPKHEGVKRDWIRFAFKNNFPKRPHLFVTPQQSQGDAAFVVRAKKLKSDGFSVAAFEQEANGKAHAREESVAYLAIYAPIKKGTVDLGYGPVPFEIKKQRVRMSAEAFGRQLKVEEEQSKDEETKHTRVTASVMLIDGQHLFAQDVSGRGGNTFAFRYTMDQLSISTLKVVESRTDSIDLAWNPAAGKEAEKVVSYQVLRDDVPVTTTADMHYTDAGLASDTTYQYKVNGLNAEGRVIVSSAVVKASTGKEEEKPVELSAPRGLEGAAEGSGWIELSWQAPEKGAAIAYKVYRDGTLVATTAESRHSDKGLGASTTYRYHVVAIDDKGNMSAVSNTASVTTIDSVDSTPPTVPLLLSTAAATDSVSLSWQASTDNAGVTGYEVRRNGAVVARVEGQSYQDDGLESATVYSYQVRAYDAAGNYSGAATATAVTEVAPDTEAPSQPAQLKATATTDAVQLGWKASSDNKGVSGYEVSRNGTVIATVQNTSYKDTGLKASTGYSYQVLAVDAAGNKSSAASVNAKTAEAPDTQAPSQPTQLKATATTSTVQLNWKASSDNKGVSGYEVIKNDAVIAKVQGNGYKDAGLKASTGYSYQVRAYDAAGNRSSAATVSVTTSEAPDTQAPSVPANMTAQANNTLGVINISWAAAIDNKGVVAYEVRRDGQVLASTADTTYRDDTVQRDRAYRYSVVALDAAENRSSASTEASAKLAKVDSGPVNPDLEQALATGNVAYTASNEQLIEPALAEITRIRQQGEAESNNQLYKPENLDKLQALLIGIRDNNFKLDWTTERYGKYNKYFVEHLKSISEVALEQLGKLDRGSSSIFPSESNRLEKLLILLGDRLRQDIVLPMRGKYVDHTTFAKAYLADHTLYHSREHNPAQKHLGNFSRSDYSGAKRVTKTLSYQHVATKKYYQAAKVYAIPGQTFKVTRLDDGPAYVGVKLNSLRDNTYGPFARYSDGWDRPTTVTTKRFGVGRGETITLTSPIGGPIQYFVKGNNGKDIQLKFENVGEHPVYDGPESLEKFKAAMDANEYDWVEVVLPNFVLHTTREKMLASLNSMTIERMVEMIWQYNHADLLNLAGRSGPGLSPSPGVAKFCADHDWNCVNKETGGNVQHVNSDRPSCGIACSGNPFDMAKPYHPLRWGTMHELGHNLQSGTFQIYGATGEVMNNIFPVHAKRSHKIETTGTYPINDDSRDKAAYRDLQAAFNAADPKAEAKSLVWEKHFNSRLPFYLQMALNNSDVAHLGDSGWDVWPLLYKRKGQVGGAAKDETTWQAKKANLGLSLYSREEAGKIGSIDFMLTGLSFITKRDQRPFFDMWGLDYSDKASQQVASFGYTAAPKRYVVRGFDAPMGGIALPVDGKSTWPAAY